MFVRSFGFKRGSLTGWHGGGDRVQHRQSLDHMQISDFVCLGFCVTWGIVRVGTDILWGGFFFLFSLGETGWGMFIVFVGIHR